MRELGEMLPARAASSPDRLAFADDDGGGLSYRDLDAAAARGAALLAASGVGRSDRLALCLPSGLGFVCTFYAAQRLGAVPCAFDPAAPPATVAGRVARARPLLALVPPDAGALAAALDAACIRTLAFDAGDRAGAAAAPRSGAADPAAPAFLQPTSGTSGEPRLAMVSHRAALASLVSARRYLGVRPDDVLVCWVPPWHDLGLLRFVLGPVFFGVPCHLVPPAIRTLPRWLETIERAGGTITGAPDFAYRLAVRLAGTRRFDLSTLRAATNGGEPVRRSTIEDFERRFGVPGVVRPGYGLAEATLGVAAVRPGAPLRFDGQDNVSCGPPLPGVEVRVAEEAGGAAGELLVRSPALFSGYFDAPEATAAVLSGGWLHTGDVGRVDADGWVTVLGRRRALLKRGGAPLAPRELEEVAERLPGVRASAAVAAPGDGGGASESIVLVVERDPAAEEPPRELAAAAAAAVEDALGFAPGRVVVVAPRTIPRTANGKVRYLELAGALAAGRLWEGGEVLFSDRPAGR